MAWSNTTINMFLEYFNISTIFEYLPDKGTRTTGRPICIEQINVIIETIQSVIPEFWGRRLLDFPITVCMFHLFENNGLTWMS